MTLIDTFQQVKDRESWSSLLQGIGMVMRAAPVSGVRGGKSSSDPIAAAYPAPIAGHDHASPHNATEADAERPSKRIRLSKPEAGRPRGAPPTAPNTTPRPPTKLTLREPDGDLLQTTNGVRTRLNIDQDELQAVAGAAAPDSEQRPSSAKSQDKRTLRSHDEGARLKSELSIYFPNYEDVINDVPAEPELLDIDTLIHLGDETDKRASTKTTSPSTPKAPKTPRSSHGRQPSSLAASASPFALSPSASKYNGAQVVDFSSIEKSVPDHPQDPLTDAVYFKPHRRAERKEKQLRNIEKERAMHEKVQLERLLEGLHGHDWLKVMGITGITDSEAKKFEPKRDYFVREVLLLVTKFKTWREEERRMKLGKEAAALARGGEDEDEDERVEEQAEGADAEPDSSEIDASAARQLQMEASESTPSGRSRQRMPPRPAPVYREPSPEQPFLSFYSKPHVRAAALGKQRHGRTVTAFGVAVPDLDEQDFALPHDYTTKEALKESARRRRRMKRESIVDSSAA